MQPSRFLNAARRLANGSEPEDYRSAISRAYYAVYNVAEQFLERMKFHKPKREYHAMLHRRLMACGDALIAQIGSDLSDFHEERVEADYKMASSRAENPANAAAAVTKAGVMIVDLGTCPINSARWQEMRKAIAKANVTGTDNLVLTSGS